MVGRPFYPEAFDLQWINKHLQRLKPPRLTYGQLARVLMARDNYQERCSTWVPTASRNVS